MNHNPNHPLYTKTKLAPLKVMQWIWLMQPDTFKRISFRGVP